MLWDLSDGVMIGSKGGYWVRYGSEEIVPLLKEE